MQSVKSQQKFTATVTAAAVQSSLVRQGYHLLVHGQRSERELLNADPETPCRSGNGSRLSCGLLTDVVDGTRDSGFVSTSTSCGVSFGTPTVRWHFIKLGGGVVLWAQLLVLLHFLLSQSF